MFQRSPDYGHVTSREALAWAAGFFDGEGSTCITGAYNFAFTITQKHREPLDWFLEATGCEARIYGPYTYKDGRDGKYELRINGLDRANAVLDLLWPWLGPAKREQAERARQVWASRATTRKIRVRPPGRKRNKPKDQEYNQQYYSGRRAKVLEHYGTVCACCGSNERLYLIHMDNLKFKRGSSFDAWLIQNNYPPGFETLCCSCAMSKRTWGECRRPHGDRKAYLLRVMLASQPGPAQFDGGRTGRARQRVRPMIIYINGLEYPRCESRYFRKRCSDAAEHDGGHHNAYLWWASSEAEREACP